MTPIVCSWSGNERAMLENMRLSTPLVFYYAVLFQEHVLWSFEIREVSCNDTNDCSGSLDTWHVSRLCCRLSIFPLLCRYGCCFRPGVGPFSVITLVTKLRMNLFQALLGTDAAHIHLINIQSSELRLVCVWAESTHYRPSVTRVPIQQTVPANYS